MYEKVKQEIAELKTKRESRYLYSGEIKLLQELEELLKKAENISVVLPDVIQSIFPSQQDIGYETAGLCESDQLYEGFISGIDYMTRRIKEKTENILM